METKWLISVKENAILKVADALKKMKVKNLEILESIGVIIIDPSDLKMNDIKKINGVLNIEEEKDVSI